jgi:hypothetical protein
MANRWRIRGFGTIVGKYKCVRIHLHVLKRRNMRHTTHSATWCDVRPPPASSVSLSQRVALHSPPHAHFKQVPIKSTDRWPVSRQACFFYGDAS